MEEIKEAEATITNVMVKPVEVEPIAKIKNLGSIETNIEQVKDYAQKIKEYYGKLVITGENLNIAKDEKATIRKIKDKISDFRKSIVKEFKSPVEIFETTAKEVEKLLDESYEVIDAQCDIYDQEKRQALIDDATTYFDELKATKNISFILFSKSGIKVNMSDSKTKIHKAIDDYISKIEQDLTTIESLDNKEDVLVEYMADCNLAKAIKTANDKRVALEQIKEQNILNEEPRLVKKSTNVILKAPIKTEKVQTTELVEASFKVTTTEDELKGLVEFMKVRGIIYESIE